MCVCVCMRQDCAAAAAAVATPEAMKIQVYSFRSIRRFIQGKYYFHLYFPHWSTSVHIIFCVPHPPLDTAHNTHKGKYCMYGI